MSVKKLFAAISSLALLGMEALMYVPAVNAASVSVSTTGSTTTSLSLTLGSSVAIGEKVTVSVKRLDGTNTGIDIDSATTDVQIGGSDVSTVDASSADSITVTAAAAGTALVVSNITLPDNENYLVSVSSEAGLYGAGQLTLGTPTSNTVQVSATVIPTLSMSLTNQTINFGTLIQGSVATAASGTVVSVSTNAANGYTVRLASANGALTGTSTPVASSSADLSVAAKGYGVQAVSTAGTPSLDAAYNLAASNVGQLQTSAQVLFTNSTLATSDKVTVTYKAKIDNTVVAGNYSDTLTYTVTGNF